MLRGVLSLVVTLWAASAWPGPANAQPAPSRPAPPVLAAPAEPAKPWVGTDLFVSPIDGRRTFAFVAERGDLIIRFGCRLDRTLVQVTFAKLLLPNRDKVTGAYRIDQRPVVVVAWMSEDALSWSLDVPEARAALETLFTGRVIHIRIGELERSIPLDGIAALQPRYREACRPAA
ncbi:hypothetical protein [Phreatobacter aquaticus]|uniref:hypothetical protein n=1 Tax=Phreatobacter aquaticus TaxID=2570229 RepID=UPI00143D9EF0|nr:hypothetical protein [Phreatobacter aquaticus]